MLNRGVAILNKQVSTEKTVIVMGVARSGTTMTADVIQKLGVDMGEENSGVVNERRDVYELLENGKIQQFEQLVATQNETYNKWGWKRPKSVNYVDLFHNRVRNPHYVIPYRDYLSIATRNNISLDLDIMKNLQATHQRYAEILDVVSNLNAPLFLFSYEKAINYKAHFVKQLAGFLGITEMEKIEFAINSINIKNNAYLNMNNILGSLDKVSKGIIHGWAKKEQSQKPMKLALFIDGKEISQFIADKKRPDLAKYGNHAFAYRFNTDGLVVGSTYKVVVKDMQGNKLRNSPYDYIHE